MGKNQDPGSGFRDKHPGSAILRKTMDSCVSRCFAVEQAEGPDPRAAALSPGAHAAAQQGGGRHLRLHAQPRLPAARHQSSGQL
jgi:hypothetical protein